VNVTKIFTAAVAVGALATGIGACGTSGTTATKAKSVAAAQATQLARTPAALTSAQKAAAKVAAAKAAAAQAAQKAAAKVAAAKAAAAQAAQNAAAAKAAAAKAAAAKAYAHRVLAHLSGNGIANSVPFLVTASPVTATYTYDCSAAGGSGNFIADMETPNQSSLSSDDQSIANALGAGGTATTTLYPTDTGQNYHLSVNSECSWSVTLTAG
jgi:nucleoid-associated protein YgaU